MREIEYIKAIEICANSDKTIEDRGELIIRNISRTTIDILDYKYALNNYKGDGTVLADKRNVVKNSIALLESEIEIYKKMLGITDDVYIAKCKRTIKVAERINKEA